MTRRYESPLRDARASQTRAALLDACEAILLAEDGEELTLPAVAQRAGVSKPTAYSHFPDRDALIAGFLDHMRERIGTAHEVLSALEPEALAAATRGNYRRYEAQARLVLRLMDSPSYERVRLAKEVDRAALVLPRWRRRAAIAPRVLRERLGPLYLLVTPASWRWLRQTWGLSGAASARAASWAVTTLVQALLAAHPDRPPRPPRAAARKKEKPR